MKIDEERFDDEFRFSENGLLTTDASRSCGVPKIPKVVESCSTGLRRIDEDCDVL